MGGYSGLPQLQTPNIGASIQQALNQSQQEQMGQIELRNAKQAQTDSQGLTRAIREANGDPDKVSQLAVKYGVSATGLSKYQDGIAQYRDRISQSNKTDLETENQYFENRRGALKPLVELADNTPKAQMQAQPQAQTQGKPNSGVNSLSLLAMGGGQPSGETTTGIQEPQGGRQDGNQLNRLNYMQGNPQAAGQGADPFAAKKQQVWEQQRSSIINNYHRYGYKSAQDAAQQIPQQYPGDQAIHGLDASFATGHALHQEANERLSHMTPDKIAMEDYEKQGMSPSEAFRQVEADKAGSKTTPLPAAKADFYNQQFESRWQVLHPGQRLPAQYRLQAGDTQKDLVDTDRALEQVEKAEGVKAQQDANRRATKDAATEKSYQFNSNQLEKIAQPVDQMVARISRLKDTLAQNSPQADSLVAPELLTVMAGGPGSGLRMNEAEIARIVGGRSNLEGLKAWLNQWQLDPTKANSLTPAQRKQVRDLVATVDDRLSAKQRALDEARNNLYQATDSTQHKMIVVNARSKMSGIDQGGSAANSAPQGQIRVQIPGHPAGWIPASARQQFLQDNPGAKVIE